MSMKDDLEGLNFNISLDGSSPTKGAYMQNESTSSIMTDRSQQEEGSSLFSSIAGVLGNGNEKDVPAY